MGVSNVTSLAGAVAVGDNTATAPAGIILSTTGSNSLQLRAPSSTIRLRPAAGQQVIFENSAGGDNISINPGASTISNAGSGGVIINTSSGQNISIDSGATLALTSAVGGAINLTSSGNMVMTVNGLSATLGMTAAAGNLSIFCGASGVISFANRNLTSINRTLAAAGSPATPAYSFSSATNAGIFLKTGSSIGFASNGQECLIASGNSGTGALSVSSVVPTTTRFLITDFSLPAGMVDLLTIANAEDAIGDRFVIKKTTGFVGINNADATPTQQLDISGNIRLRTIGNGLRIAEGANARMGVAVLVAGTVTVANTSITATTRIFYSVSTAGGVQGFLSTTQIAATSFAINSTNVLDTSTVNWSLIEPA